MTIINILLDLIKQNNLSEFKKLWLQVSRVNVEVLAPFAQLFDVSKFIESAIKTSIESEHDEPELLLNLLQHNTMAEMRTNCLVRCFIKHKPRQLNALFGSGIRIDEQFRKSKLYAELDPKQKETLEGMQCLANSIAIINKVPGAFASWTKSREKQLNHEINRCGELAPEILANFVNDIIRGITNNPFKLSQWLEFAELIFALPSHCGKLILLGDLKNYQHPEQKKSANSEIGILSDADDLLIRNKAQEIITALKSKVNQDDDNDNLDDFAWYFKTVSTLTESIEDSRKRLAIKDALLENNCEFDSWMTHPAQLLGRECSAAEIESVQQLLRQSCVNNLKNSVESIMLTLPELNLKKNIKLPSLEYTWNEAATHEDIDSMEKILKSAEVCEQLLKSESTQVKVSSELLKSLTTTVGADNKQKMSAYEYAAYQRNSRMIDLLVAHPQAPKSGLMEIFCQLVDREIPDRYEIMLTLLNQFTRESCCENAKFVDAIIRLSFYCKAEVQPAVNAIIINAIEKGLIDLYSPCNTISFYLPIDRTEKERYINYKFENVRDSLLVHAANGNRNLVGFILKNSQVILEPYSDMRVLPLLCAVNAGSVDILEDLLVHTPPTQAELIKVAKVALSAKKVIVAERLLRDIDLTPAKNADTLRALMQNSLVVGEQDSILFLLKRYDYLNSGLHNTIHCGKPGKPGYRRDEYELYSPSLLGWCLRYINSNGSVIDILLANPDTVITEKNLEFGNQTICALEMALDQCGSWERAEKQYTLIQKLLSHPKATVDISILCTAIRKYSAVPVIKLILEKLSEDCDLEPAFTMAIRNRYQSKVIVEVLLDDPRMNLATYKHLQFYLSNKILRREEQPLLQFLSAWLHKTKIKTLDELVESLFKIDFIKVLMKSNNLDWLHLYPQARHENRKQAVFTLIWVQEQIRHPSLFTKPAELFNRFAGVVKADPELLLEYLQAILQRRVKNPYDVKQWKQFVGLYQQCITDTSMLTSLGAIRKEMDAYCFVEPKSTGKISDEMALLAASSSASSSSSASATTLPEFAETHIKTLVDCEFEEIFKEYVFTVEEFNALSELLVPSVTRSVEEDRKQQLLQKQARALCVKLGSQIPELLARPIGLSNTLSEHHASTALFAFKRHLGALLIKLREMQVVAPVAAIQQAPVTVAPSAVHFSPAPSFPAVPDHDLPVVDKSKTKVLA